MADTRCEVTELVIDQCAHCRRSPDLPREMASYGPWFTGAFPGRCSDCDERIEPGDRIRGDGQGSYQCRECGEDEA